MPKYVVSTTMDDPEWNNSTVIRDNVAGRVAELKQKPGGDILVNGSMRLIKTLMENDLVDEYRLMVFPVVLGRGKRLFGDTDAAKSMTLLEAKPVGPDGVVVLTYVPAVSREA